MHTAQIIKHKRRRVKPILVVSDKKGRIYDFPPIEACGMKGGHFFRLPSAELIKLPYGSELFMLPERAPFGYDPKSKNFITLDGYFAVASFISPGYVISHSSSYKEIHRPKMLPLFAYGAVAFYKGEFYVAAVRVDRQPRHDLRFMNIGLVRKNVKAYKKLYPRNRLIKHLEGCALIYGCPTAKNFFLSRCEAPLPTSPYCNAKCIGCISYQPPTGCCITQPRIKFFPTALEVAEVALYHIKNVKDPVASFGQGCEGEPLLEEETVEKSIRLIRNSTDKGMININTNASRPKVIAKLFDAGLNSIRVSLNSAREDYYTRYHKPIGYTYKDVIESIKIAKKKGGFVSINYLTMPGFTDSKDEYAALKNLLKNGMIDMIQWRNLNFDPLRYFKELKISPGTSQLLGIRKIIHLLKREFPKLMMGYFNPSKRRVRRNVKME
jgi:pyruvate-formate lyase-activating enzyme